MQHAFSGDVRAVVCETNPALRAGIQTALFAKGIREPTLCRDVDCLTDAMQREIVDLLVCDADLPGTDFCRMVQEIRHSAIGRNPFALIVATSSDTSAPNVRRLVGAGVDRVMRKPMPMNVLVGHIAALVQTRRPFIATEDYIGPSRRAPPRPNDGDINALDVPNTMRSRILHGASESHLQRIVDEGVERIEELKVKNGPLVIAAAIRRALLACREGNRQGVANALARVTVLTGQQMHRHRNRGATHLVDLLSSLSALVERMADCQTMPSKVSFELLANLGEVIRRTNTAGNGTIGVVQEIAATVDRFTRGDADAADKQRPSGLSGPKPLN